MNADGRGAPFARRAGMAAAAGLFLGCITEMLTRLPPYLHELLRQPVAFAGLVVILVCTMVALIVWSLQPPRLDKREFTVAVIGCGALCGISGVAAIRVGWWSGPAFEMTWPVFGAVYWFGGMGYFAAILLPYRWLSSQRYRWGRVAYVIGALSFIAVATWVGDELCVEFGVYSFGSGYKIWHDVVYGLAIFSSPLVVYEILRRRKPELA